jgi:hypothetical protein
MNGTEKFWLVWWAMILAGASIIAWAIVWWLTTLERQKLDAGLIPTRVPNETFYRVEWLPKGEKVEKP